MVKNVKTKRYISVIALILILIMVFGSVAGALTGCGAANAPGSDVVVRVASLKGPTTIGLVHLMDSNENSEKPSYEFTMYTAGSDIMAAMAAGSIDIGLVPANVACVMNNKVEGGVKVIDINTLGVLYCITSDPDISTVADLSGKTLYTTGQGATPEYTIRHLLEQNGVTDCTLEFKSEATEVAAFLTSEENAVAILPQPFATAALMLNENLRVAFSLDDEWERSGCTSRIVTGVTVVSNKFLEQHKGAVDKFLKDHAESAQKANEDVSGTAALTVDQGIIAKESIAQKAIPQCNITFIAGDEMKKILSGYLEILADKDPKAVGGKLPGDEFYY